MVYKGSRSKGWPWPITDVEWNNFLNTVSSTYDGGRPITWHDVGLVVGEGIMSEIRAARAGEKNLPPAAVSLIKRLGGPNGLLILKMREAVKREKENL